MSSHEQGCWSFKPGEVCPRCGKPVVIATTFKFAGEHRVKFCLPCRIAWENEKVKGPIEVYPEPTGGIA